VEEDFFSFDVAAKPQHQTKKDWGEHTIMSYEAKLQAMGYEIAPVALDNGKFLLAVQTGNLIFTAGHVSRWNGQEIKGKLGSELSLEQGYEAAKYSALGCLQAVKTLTGSLDNVSRIVKVLGMVNAGPDFNNTPAVIHGCSDLLREVFGEAGRHARSAVGMVIPFDFAVEIEMVVEVNS
jgi:enamine deaminase RidA (YjgF/YER057c/UK114 family)